MTSHQIYAALLALATSLPALAGPGAHGPNGEHLDAPAQAATGAHAAPRLEAKTEQFELVATLAGGELSLLIDRFETNEPLLDAKVEVESGGLKAPARFHADHGDYAVDDPALLTLLGQPGAHALLITVLAGQESDLLDGTLKVAAPDPVSHANSAWGAAAKWLGAGFALLLGLLLIWRLRRSQLGARA
jgi:hypothetical protein